MVEEMTIESLIANAKPERKAVLTPEGEIGFQDIKANDWYIASIWGIAEVEKKDDTSGYMVTVKYDDRIIGFIHVDTIEY